MSTKAKLLRVRSTIEPEGAHVVAYCDGSCPITNGDGGWGFVVSVDGDTHEQCGGVIRDATNNTMEIMAGYECLRYLYNERWERRPVLICTDSQYLVGGMHQWRGKWEANGFANVKNTALWKEIHAEFDRFDFCTFAWVRGHVGHYFNERADRLADMGRRNTMASKRELDRGEHSRRR